MNFTYEWKLSDLEKVPKKNIKVFSTFACGGGSSMGYKMAGYDVLGCVEIDKKINAIYKKNLNPKYNFCEDIRDFNKRTDIPKELFSLDILDGSPPCSSFSISGNREKDWGKEKKFAEGQKLQRLDDLFFEYINTVALLRPKIFIAENVKGLISGNAKSYAIEIAKRINEIGYTLQLFLLNAGNMGVPQKRERVFFIGHKKELDLKKLEMEFNEAPILYREIKGKAGKPLSPLALQLFNKNKNMALDGGSIPLNLKKERANFNRVFLYDNKLFPTITSRSSSLIRSDTPFYAGLDDLRKAQTFPSDYKDLSQFILGMPVPPLMIYKIVKKIEEQWSF